MCVCVYFTNNSKRIAKAPSRPANQQANQPTKQSAITSKTMSVHNGCRKATVLKYLLRFDTQLFF